MKQEITIVGYSKGISIDAKLEVGKTHLILFPYQNVSKMYVRGNEISRTGSDVSVTIFMFHPLFFPHNSCIILRYII